jgi:protein gp37
MAPVAWRRARHADMSITKIEWAKYTWNPWVGCDKTNSPCCAACYAAVTASRRLHPAHVGTADAGEWTGVLNLNTPKIWQAPFHWKSGLVFTCSVSDFFHERVPREWHDGALNVIEDTPQLTYLILTKRPGNVARRLADLKRSLPRNVWIGATIGHQQDLPLLKPLLNVAAKLRFLSCEPLLTDLSDLSLDGIGWVIGGGESGPKARHCDPDWMRTLRDQCVDTRTPFFLKQWGNWPSNPTPRDQELDLRAKGGATLDGRLWREFPDPSFRSKAR